MSAQDGIKVNFKGAAPDIMDFAWSYVTSSDGNEDEEVDEFDRSFPFKEKLKLPGQIFG